MCTELITCCEAEWPDEPCVGSSHTTVNMNRASWHTFVNMNRTCPDAFNGNIIAWERGEGIALWGAANNSTGWNLCEEWGAIADLHVSREIALNLFFENIRPTSIERMQMCLQNSLDKYVFWKIEQIWEWRVHTRSLACANKPGSWRDKGVTLFPGRCYPTMGNWFDFWVPIH